MFPYFSVALRVAVQINILLCNVLETKNDSMRKETPCKNVCLFLLKNFHEHDETTHFLRLGTVDEFNHVFILG